MRSSAIGRTASPLSLMAGMGNLKSEKSEFEELLERLAFAGRSSWEDEYARRPVATTRDQVAEVFNSDRAYAEWLGFRFDAGPPGEPLPTLEHAVEGVMSGKAPTALDAYRVVFDAKIPSDTNPAFLVAILVNSTLAALKNRTTWFATWLAARSGLAAIALGQPQHAWQMLDALTFNGRRHPSLRKLELFETLRESDEVAKHPLIRATIVWLWPHLKVPAIPCLPAPSAEELDANVDDLLDQLSELRADSVRELVGSYIKAKPSKIVETHETEPLVKDLRSRVMSGNPTPDQVASLPEWFESWALGVARAGEFELARLAGLLLAREGGADPRLVANLVLRAARASDVPTLLNFVLGTELETVFSELHTAAQNLPTDLADALVATAVPENIRAPAAFELLSGRIDELSALDAAPNGVVAGVAKMVSQMTADRNRDHQALRVPLLEACQAATREAARLQTSTIHMDRTALEKAASKISVPPLTSGLFEAGLIVVQEQPPLTGLLFALALRGALGGTVFESRWLASVTVVVTDLILLVKEPSLYGLRLALLNETIQIVGPEVGNGELYFQRGNTRRALSGGDHDDRVQCSHDFETAIRAGYADRDTHLVAVATAAWAKATVDLGDTDPVATLQRGLDGIERALELGQDSFDRAVLLYARGHLLRGKDPVAAEGAFGAAMKELGPAEPLWAEIAGALVAILGATGRSDEAIQCAEDSLGRVASSSAGDELGMLRLSLGTVLIDADRLNDAKEQLEAGLALLRGDNPANEALARLHLSRIYLAEGDLGSAEEHLDFVVDHRAELDAATQHDLDRMEVAVARRCGNQDAERVALMRQLEQTSIESQHIGLSLQVVRLDLAAGRSVNKAEALLLKAVRSKLDQEGEAAIVDISCNYELPLSEDARRAVGTWAMERGRPSIVATMQRRAGDLDKARSTLRKALTSVLGDFERLSCTHQLMITVESGARTERRRLCGDLTQLLEEVSDEPSIRLDLATAISMDAEGDPDVLERARNHIESSLSQVLDGRLIELGHRTLVDIILKQLHVRFPESSPALVKIAAPLLSDLVIPEPQVSKLRLQAAQTILRAGPLTHPDAAAVAQRLVELADTAQVLPVAGPLEARARWVNRCCEGDYSPPDSIREPNPFDEVPGWLVALVHGYAPVINADSIEKAFAFLALASSSRPDAADHVLSEVLAWQDRLPQTSRDDLLDTIYSIVQGNPHLPLPGLLEQLSRARTNADHPRLQDIESALARLSTPENLVSVVAPVHAPRVGAEKTPPPDFTGTFERAISLMQFCQASNDHPDAAASILESRGLFEELVRIAREQDLPELFDFLVSHANALRTPPQENLRAAIEIYDALGGFEALPEQKAKMWKVHADALLQCGADEDIRKAERLLTQSLQIRRGWLRTETLQSAARAAHKHPDFDERTRESRAAELLMDAVRACPSHAKSMLAELVFHLAQWTRLQPRDPAPEQLRQELRRTYPDLIDEIDAPRPTPVDIGTITSYLTHPAGRAFMGVRARLHRVDPDADAFGMFKSLPVTVRNELVAQAERDSLVDRPDEIEALLDASSDRPESQESPGILAARVALLAHSVRTGRRSTIEVVVATDIAVAAVRGLSNHPVQAWLLTELALLWAPSNHVDDPVCDFDRALELLEIAVELEGGEDSALLNTLGALARAQRYAKRGNKYERLVNARRLYRVCINRCSNAGGLADLASLQMNLAEVEGHLAVGSRKGRRRLAVEGMEEAVAAARTPGDSALCRANLAWEQTQLGIELGDRELLVEACSTFATVQKDALDSSIRAQVSDNYVVCRAAVARLDRDRAGQLTLWRDHLYCLDESAGSYRMATVKHNLGSALMFGPDVSPSELVEGLRASRASAIVRSIDSNPRHHWETADNLGRGLTGALYEGWLDAVGMSAQEIAVEARGWFESAIEAAQRLGAGEEVLRSAFAMAELALLLPTRSSFVEYAERAWEVVGEAVAFSLLDDTSRQREAQLAHRIAATLADFSSAGSLAISSAGVAFVLHGDSAKAVARWIVRGQNPSRRSLRARLARHNDISAAEWEVWIKALQSHGEGDIADALRGLRAVAPDFLREDDANEATWRWLEGRPGSVAVAPLLEPLPLVVLLQADSSGRRTWVLGLDLPPPPRSLEGLDEMRADSEVMGPLVALAEWIRHCIVEPVLRFLDVEPTTVLWGPGPGLRRILPGAIWDQVPVAMTTSFVLPDSAMAPKRRRSTLLVLADPGEGAKDPSLDLGGQGVKALSVLEQASRQLGPVRLLGSVGGMYGRALLGTRPEVRDSPASPEDILAEVIEHQVVVLVAHGQVERLEDAALLCLDATGEVQHLDVARLSLTPDCFAGATMLLLSCDGGRIGDSLVEPGGLAGTFLAAGARCVVAPLLPIRLDVAENVGRAVLEGMAAGEEPWMVLSNLNLDGSEASPQLGGPPPSLAQRRAEHEFYRSAFVTWVG